jgi:RND family efflux transporter MFP subunit
VAAGQTVVRLARLDELEAVVAVPEQKLDEVTDASAAVELWPANGKRYRATLREVSPEADPVARTFQARFSIPDPDQEVRLGKTATVVLTPTATTRVARLPLSAVINDGKGPMVWVVNASGSRIKRREVSIAAFTKNAALVATGLNPGERVVTLGAHLLDEGTPVRVVETQSFARAHSGDTQK